MNNIKLSILILNYNTEKLIIYLLKNIFSLKLNYSFEIILIDSSINKQLKKEIQTYLNDIKYLEVPNKGYATGNNAGLKIAQGEYLLIINPDIYIQNNAIDKLINFMDNHHQCGIAGPMLLYPNGDYQYSCLRYPDWKLPFLRRTKLGETSKGKNWLDNYQMTDYEHIHPAKVDWLFGAAFIIRNQAMQEIGLLDERFFMYFEDLDWCRRFWQKGWEVWYVPDAKFIHFHSHDSADKMGLKGLLTKLGRVQLISWFKYLWKWR